MVSDFISRLLTIKVDFLRHLAELTTPIKAKCIIFDKDLRFTKEPLSDCDDELVECTILKFDIQEGFVTVSHDFGEDMDINISDLSMYVLMWMYNQINNSSFDIDDNESEEG